MFRLPAKFTASFMMCFYDAGFLVLWGGELDTLVLSEG